MPKTTIDFLVLSLVCIIILYEKKVTEMMKAKFLPRCLFITITELTNFNELRKSHKYVKRFNNIMVKF
jgi:hypothetical protein